MSTTVRRSASSAAGRRLVSYPELEEFHRAYFLPLVRRATWRYGLTKEDARDVVQEAFLLAVVKLRAEGNPKAWLTRVVDHLSLNLRRKDQRHAALGARWGFAVDAFRGTEEEGDPGGSW